MCYAEDCNSNGIDDTIDISSNGSSNDCNTNSIPDECDLISGAGADCNSNYLLDSCDIDWGASEDVNTNGVPDECEIPSGPQIDCNLNGIADALDISEGRSKDCNENGIPDICDIDSGTSTDCDINGIPDECVSLPPVDVVFVVDTSDMMQDFYWGTGSNRMLQLMEHVETMMQANNAITGQGVDLRCKKLTICDPGSETMGFDGASCGGFGGDSTPCSECPGLSDVDPDLYNSWGHAVSVLSRGMVWRENAIRIVVPMSNGAPCQGSVWDSDYNDYCSAVPDPEFGIYDDCTNDNTVLEGAIEEALKHRVYVYPIMGTSPGNAHLAQYYGTLIAQATDGEKMNLPGLSANLEVAAQQIAETFLQRVLVDYDMIRHYDPDFVWYRTDYPRDCNGNNRRDICDIQSGCSSDFNQNWIPDDCEWVDCNENSGNDIYDIYYGVSQDLQGNWIPDECEEDDILLINNTSGLDVLLNYYKEHENECDRKNQIWLLHDTYLPSTIRTFHMSQHLQIYGGFYYDESTNLARDHVQYETILSGDIDGDDALTGDYLVEDANNAEVVVSSDFKTGWLLDGIIIECACGSEALSAEEERESAERIPENFGAGLYVDDGNVTIRNCIFRYNRGAGTGGGVCIRAIPFSNIPDLCQSIHFENCLFEHNYSNDKGGGIAGYTATTGTGVNKRLGQLRISLKDCVFSDNFAVWGGGGLFAEGYLGTTEEESSRAELVVKDCTFSGNGLAKDNSNNDIFSYQGGGAEVALAVANFEGCAFTENNVSNYGGGLFTVDTLLNIDRCLFSNNLGRLGALSYGGGLNINHYTNKVNSITNVANSIFHHNHSAYGGGICHFGGRGDFVNCTIARNYAYVSGSGIDCSDSLSNNINLTNSILYFNTTDIQFENYQIAQSSGANTDLSISYCDIEDGQSGVYHIQNGGIYTWGEGNIEGGVDPVFLDEECDYHLLWNSPCLDAGNNRFVRDFDLDLDGNQRIQNNGNGRIVNMGAYEGLRCDGIDAIDLPFDYDDDCDVDLADYAYFQQCFDTSDSICLSEFDTVNPNNLVDLDDLAEFVAEMNIMGGPFRNTTNPPVTMSVMAPMMEMESLSVPEAAEPEVEPWGFNEGELSLIVKPVSGGQSVTTLSPHTTYKLKYRSDYSATEFLVLVYAATPWQGLASAAVPARGDWSDSSGFEFHDYQADLGILDDVGEDGLRRTDLIINVVSAASSTTGTLCEFTTGDAGTLELLVELVTMDEEHQETTYMSNILELVVD